MRARWLKERARGGTPGLSVCKSSCSLPQSLSAHPLTATPLEMLSASVRGSGSDLSFGFGCSLSRYNCKARDRTDSPRRSEGALLLCHPQTK